MSGLILHADHTSQFGGTEIHLCNQLKRFRKSNVNVGILFGDKGPIYDELSKFNVPIFYTPIPKIKSIIGLINSIGKVRKIIRDNDVSIIHCHSFRSNVVVGIAGKLEKKKVIWHMHESLERPQVSIFNYLAIKCLINYIPDYVIANSKYTLDTLKIKNNFKVVYPSIDINKFILTDNQKEKSDIINITIIGRIARWKGQHIFIKAASIVCKLRKDVRFIIAGAPIFEQYDYDKELKSLVNKLNLNKYVIFKGHVKDIPKLLNDTDISVHCSIEPEPFGQVVIQAMAAGNPIIATAHGGPLEIIDNRINGILIEPNDPQILADTIIELLDNKELFLNISKRAKEKVKIFSEEVQDKITLEVYKTLM